MELTFADVLEIYNGRNQRHVENPAGKYPIYGSGGVIGFADDFICPKNTVVIGRKGNINKPIFVTMPFWNVDTAFGLVAKSGILLPKYLYYFCEWFDFEKLNTTVTIPSLTKANLLQIHIHLPSMEDQQKIVQKFEAVETLISHRQDEIHALDQLIKARFVEMFGDFKTNSKGWVKGPLKDHASVIVGYPFPSEGYSSEGIDIVGGYNLMQGYIQWEESKHWPTEKGFEAYMLHENDIVMAMDRPWVNGGFKIARIDIDHLPAILIQRTACIRGKDVEQEFLYYMLDSNRFAEHCNITGSLVPHISNKDINSYEIILPPKDEQKRFAAFVSQVDKSKLSIQASLDQLETLKQSLMQKYFG